MRFHGRLGHWHAVVRTFRKAEQIIFVKGNCDGDVDHIRMFVEELGGKHHLIVEETINKKFIGIIHGDNEGKLEDMIHSNKFDYIFHGHTHQKRNDKIEKTRVINPGAHYFHTEGTVAILDIDEDKVEFNKL